MAASREQHRSTFVGGPKLRLRGLRDRETQIIELAGDLDLATASELTLAIEVAGTTSARLIVLDLRGLEFIDSSGIHAVVDARRRLGERLVIVRGSACVHRVFELCRLVEGLAFADVPPSRDEAHDVAPLPRDGAFQGPPRPAEFAKTPAAAPTAAQIRRRPGPRPELGTP
jgi:anti-anti-sigma factor